MQETIKQALYQIRQQKPLILNITNDVTMDIVANGLLSLGALPVMSKAPEEAEDLVKIAHAVVINMGTLDEAFITLCHQVCRWANHWKKPLILDPVGAGASRYRTETCLALMKQYDMTILRGNASEILALAEKNPASFTKGVDAIHHSHEVIEQAKSLLQQKRQVIVISGKTDIILSTEKIEYLDYGSDWMPKITGVGCLMNTIIAAFHAVEQNPFTACAYATEFYGKTGEIAAKKAKGPATFKLHLIDALYRGEHP